MFKVSVVFDENEKGDDIRNMESHEKQVNMTAEYDSGDLVQLYHDTAEKDISQNILHHVIIL